MKIGKPAEPKLPVPLANGTQSTATPAPSAADASKTAAATASTAPAIPVKADASAKIELSSTASTLLSSQSTPEFDSAKVASISSKIDSGSYKINPEVIADKLISNAREVLTRARAS